MGSVLYRWKSWGSKLICSFSFKKIQGRENLILQAAFRWSLTVTWSLELWAVCGFFTDQFTVPCQESPFIFFTKLIYLSGRKHFTTGLYSFESLTREKEPSLKFHHIRVCVTFVLFIGCQSPFHPWSRKLWKATPNGKLYNARSLVADQKTSN